MGITQKGLKLIYSDYSRSCKYPPHIIINLSAQMTEHSDAKSIF